jgi:N-hydroxyarylamine O-acetyltransferase
VTRGGPALTPALRERVLAQLGYAAAPGADLAGLADLYARWCRRVPFDNLRKLVHLRSGAPGPLPGDHPEDFFAAWLDHGTGGTCWAGNGALAALLTSLGFETERGIATMLVAPDLPPNHGTVCVRLDAARWLVDASILHGEPLRLDAARESEVAHGAYGVRARPDGAKWLVRWRPIHKPDGFDCRIDAFGASAAEFRTLHEATRGWSPFNYALYLRVLRGERVVGAAFGQHVEIAGPDAARQRPLDAGERRRFLIEEAGISEAFVARLPDDLPLPPPPGHTAPSR